MELNGNMEQMEAADRAPVHPRLPKKLTPHEVALLKRAEKIIERGFVAFHQMGEQLRLVAKQKLYRGKYEDFEDYCERRWGFKASRARQIIGAAEVYAEIGDAVEVKPINEIQVRPLRRLPRELKIEAWKEATDVAPNPSQAQVKEAIERVLARHTEEDETVIEESPLLPAPVETTAVTVESALAAAFQPDLSVKPQEAEHIPHPLASHAEKLMEIVNRQYELLTQPETDYDALYPLCQEGFLANREMMRAIEHYRLASSN